jgi:hypothetical protein
MNSEWIGRGLTGCVLVAVLVGGAGCATKSTVETRKTERAAAYAALSEDQRKLVDEGLIQVGMGEDAVYMAWGQPDEILRSGDASGETTTWLYHGTTTDEFLYWRYYEVPRPGGRNYLTRHMDRDLNVREYVAAELVFREGQLASWRTLPKPPENTYFGSGSWR